MWSFVFVCQLDLTAPFLVVYSRCAGEWALWLIFSCFPKVQSRSYLISDKSVAIVVRRLMLSRVIRISLLELGDVLDGWYEILIYKSIRLYIDSLGGSTVSH